MNEEEKDLLDRLKYIYENDRKVNRYGSLNYSIPIGPTFCKKIIELIEKQQKEIKARLEEIDRLYKMMSVKDDELENNYVSKDKIKAKIEEIENSNTISISGLFDFLKELLGE